MAWEHPAFRRIIERIRLALRPHPDALADVLEAVREVMESEAS